MSRLLFLLNLIIQLTGSAPSVSNFASYSGVLTVSVRCGAALTLGTGSGAACAVEASGVCVAAGLAAGEGVAPGFDWAAVEPDRNNSTKNRIAEESTNAIKVVFVASRVVITTL